MKKTWKMAIYLSVNQCNFVFCAMISHWRVRLPKLRYENTELHCAPDTCSACKKFPELYGNPWVTTVLTGVLWRVLLTGVLWRVLLTGVLWRVLLTGVLWRVLLTGVLWRVLLTGVLWRVLFLSVMSAVSSLFKNSFNITLTVTSMFRKWSFLWTLSTDEILLSALKLAARNSGTKFFLCRVAVSFGKYCFNVRQSISYHDTCYL